MSNAELSEQVNLSPSACHRRVQRLEAEGYIKDYVALLDARKAIDMFATLKTPVLGLVFLRFTDERFGAAQAQLEPQARAAPGRRTIGKQNYHAEGLLYLPEKARYSKPASAT